MKFFIAFLAMAFAAAEAGYAPAAVPVTTSVWPAYGGLYGKSVVSAWPYGHDGWNNGWGNGWNNAAGWNTWNNGWNSWNNDGHGWYGYPYGAAGAWSPAHYGGHKTVVQANLGKAAYPWGLPWGTYGAGVHGWTGHHGGYLPTTVVPVSKQVAATPGSVHVAAVPVGGEKVVVGKTW
ncbi:uncharacterized protein LOC115265826 [Aedes albopictus]|uniref:Secreted protein n=1 Tax=Aedes albopictus TaxID=7160 RepID=A0ABM1XNU0_AEDAL|nr:uncharacterized protein LOC115265813 [Aedes albopictus]